MSKTDPGSSSQSLDRWRERERERETFWDLHFSWVILVSLFFYSGVFLILNVFPSSGGKGISANDMGNLWC